MDEKTKAALLGGAQIIIEEVRDRLVGIDTINIPDHKHDRLVRSVEQLTGIVAQLVLSAWGEDERTMTDDEPVEKKVKKPTVKVGDVLTLIAELEAITGIDKAILLDNEGDAWQYHEADGDNPDGWYCTIPGFNNVYDAHTLSGWRPFTVIYLPPEEKK